MRKAKQNRKKTSKSRHNITSKFERGGSVWESNPPKTLLMPPNGVEVREAHRDSNAPKQILTLCA